MKNKEKYELNLQNLMELIPVSTIAKQIDEFTDEDSGKIIDRNIRWVVGDHVVYSETRDVYSINLSNSETFEFILKRPDYKKFVLACDARRKELFGKKQRTK